MIALLLAVWLQGMQKDFRAQLEAAVQQRRAAISQEYDAAARELETQERAERAQAIARFEKFLEIYPDEPRYSPDAMFRLAELRYDEAKEAEPPRFDKSIALYRALIAKFPDYRLLDAVHYLLGYVLDQQGDGAEARTAYAQLIEKFPKSSFVSEAWMRIGERAFDDGDDAAAAEAYTRVGRGPLYDKALYKLGWSYYRLDRYDDAVAAFAKLIEAGAGDLRGEALQYIAASFADEKWGGVAKAARMSHGRPWAWDVLRKLGDVYYDQTRHADAVAAYRAALAEAPAATEAPFVQQRIALSFERDRDFDAAWRERDLLVRQFGEGSAWYEANKGDAEAIQRTRDLMEKSTHDNAVFHHQQAQAYRKQGREADAQKHFAQAAAAWGTYLLRFPQAKDAYEARFFHAEALYNSGDFAAAAAEYVKVRDGEGNYRNDAAYAAALAFGKALRELPPVRKAAERGGKAVEPQPLPEAAKASIAANDKFIELLPEDERASDLAYRSAEIFYRFDNFDEARKRFAGIAQKWPKSEVAGFAANLTLETWLAEGDWAQVEQFASGRPDLASIGAGARFKRATALMEAKKWGEAGKLFLEIADAEGFDARDKALNNAAFCAQQELRFDTALKLYERLYTQYPQSPLADTALFLVGLSAEKAFEFDKAIKAYSALVEGYAQSPKRADALFNLAHALERLQRYAEAEKAYARYAELFRDRPDASELLMRGATMAEKAREPLQEIADLRQVIDRFYAQGEKVVQAWLRIGLAQRRMGDDAAARGSLSESCAEFERRRLTPQDTAAAAAAAEARFNLAEIALAEYDNVRIEAHGRGKAFDQSLKAALTRKAESREQVLAQYRDVAVRYKRPDWIVAALYRAGYVDERFSAALTEAPIPPELRKLGDEYVAQYQDTLSQASIPIDERAMQAYRKALETARELKIANAWTRRILEGLDKYDHHNFPLLKEARSQLLLEPLSPVLE